MQMNQREAFHIQIIASSLDGVSGSQVTGGMPWTFMQSWVPSNPFVSCPPWGKWPLSHALATVRLCLLCTYNQWISGIWSLWHWAKINLSSLNLPSDLIYIFCFGWSLSSSSTCFVVSWKQRFLTSFHATFQHIAQWMTNTLETLSSKHASDETENFNSYVHR